MPPPRRRRRGRTWRDMREAAVRRAPPPLAGKILYLEHLTVSFDGFKALNGLTLYVDPGELRCVIGPNGAGKTTMMDVITGKTRPDSGLGLVRSERRSAVVERAGDRAGRHRPQVSEADRVRVSHGVREPRAGARRRQVVLENAGRAADRRQSGEHRRGAGRHRLERRAPRRWRAPCRTARSSGSKSACC